MKIKVLLISSLVGMGLLVGCTDSEQPEAEETQSDVVTTASIVEEEDAFVNAMSEDGTWIVATLDDMSFDEEVVVEGEFTHRDEVARKIGLYEQDEDRNVTARYTLETPKLVIKSENTKIQSGTVVGDIYVQANGFTLSDAEVEGNVYFANEEYKSSFTKDEDSNVTGSTEIKAD